MKIYEDMAAQRALAVLATVAEDTAEATEDRLAAAGGVLDYLSNVRMSDRMEVGVLDPEAEEAVPE